MDLHGDADLDHDDFDDEDMDDMGGLFPSHGGEAPFGSLPPSMLGLLAVDKHSSWHGAVRRMEEAGFTTIAEATRSNAEWPEGLDPMSEEPAADDPDEEQHFALMVHPDGLLATMSSYAFGGEHTINELTIHHQTDLGADIHRHRRESFGSGSKISLGDGTAIFRGDHDMPTSHTGALGCSLEELYRDARPLPLEQWDPDYFYIDPRLYTAAPPDAAHGAPDCKEIAERFARRVDKDWRAFIESLPPKVARAVDYKQTVVTSAPAPNARPYAYYPTTEYLAEQLRAMGENWPSARDSAIMRSWSDSIMEALETKTPLTMLSPESQVAGGANALHVLASLSAHGFRTDRSSPAMVIDWIKAQAPEAIAELLAARDARGRTPAGVVFEAWIGNPMRHPSGSDESPLIEFFMSNGWLGAPGELGQVSYDALAPKDKPFNDQRMVFNLGHARIIDRIETASKAAGHEWLVPLTTTAGTTDDHGAAIGALLDKHGKAEGPTQAYLETLALRASIKPASRPSNSVTPRL